MAWQEYAFTRMMEANPFPASMGRVCPAPCETAAIAMKSTISWASMASNICRDWAIENNCRADAARLTARRRVIGGALAAVASYSAPEGHAVTIFEAHDHLGA